VSWTANSSGDQAGTVTIAGNAFVVNQDGVAPTVGSISLNNGPMAGGTAVTIMGTNFRAGAAVTIGGTPAAVTSINATTIVATTGAKACGTYDVVVTEGRESGTLSGAFSYTYPQNPTNLVPNIATLPGATSVTL
jgi:hypothetical protein